MSRWTAEEDATLKALAADGLNGREIARAMGDARSESAVTGRAAKIGATMRSREHEGQSLREHLAEGGRIVREEVGGAVGIHWTRASRMGGHFSAKLCERLAALGFIAPADGRENVYRLVSQ